MHIFCDDDASRVVSQGVVPYVEYAFDSVGGVLLQKKNEFISIYRKKVVSLQTKRIINNEESSINSKGIAGISDGVNRGLCTLSVCRGRAKSGVVLRVNRKTCEATMVFGYVMINNQQADTTIINKNK